jgi:hypothetical protein
MLLNVIDSLLDADIKLNYDYMEYIGLGSSAARSNIFHELSQFVPMNRRPDIITVLRSICESADLNSTQKAFYLESVACGLYEVVQHIGLINGGKK